MARKRSTSTSNKARQEAETAQQEKTSEVSKETVVANVVTTEQQTKGMKMATESLSAEQIAELMSKSRTKGAGEKVLQAFLESGEQGVVVDLKSGPLAGKTADSAAATLNNAKNRTRNNNGTLEIVNPQFDAIQVKKAGKGDGKMVALINTELVNIG